MACRVDQTGLRHLFSAWVFKFRQMAAPKRWHAGEPDGAWPSLQCRAPGPEDTHRPRHPEDDQTVELRHVRLRNQRDENAGGLGGAASSLWPAPRRLSLRPQKVPFLNPSGKEIQDPPPPSPIPAKRFLVGKVGTFFGPKKRRRRDSSGGGGIPPRN